MAIIIDKKLKPGPKYHNRLIKRLEEENKLSKTGFISLNYDILIDNALIKTHPKHHVDYGIDFTNFGKRGDWHKPDPRKSVCLFKLHGSLNWLYCPTCVSITLTKEEKRAAKLVFKPENCVTCKTEMVPIIIPPTYFKLLSNYYLREVWQKAEICLSSARRLFFCGYSFPEADIHLKYLLKRAEINRKRYKREVYIINNYEGKPIYQREFETSRYTRFLNFGKRFHYTDLSFEEFCRSGIDKA